MYLCTISGFGTTSRCSTLPVENFLSSDVKHMSLEVPAEADTVDSTLKFINHQWVHSLQNRARGR
jgi:hypothetical protein